MFLKKKMAPNFLDLATTLENLGVRWLLEKTVNFVPCSLSQAVHTSLGTGHYLCGRWGGGGNHRVGQAYFFLEIRGGPKENFMMIGGGSLCVRNHTHYNSCGRSK